MFTGNSSWLFEADDSKSKKSNLVVKLSSQCDELANEVKTLIKLRKIQKKKYGSESSGLVPKVVEFGMLVVKDNFDNGNLYGYCIMNRYRSTL